VQGDVSKPEAIDLVISGNARYFRAARHSGQQCRGVRVPAFGRRHPRAFPPSVRPECLRSIAHHAEGYATSRSLRRRQCDQYQLFDQHAPEPFGSVYSASKAAVDAITRSLGKELGSRRIRVNSINPGMVDTEGSRRLAVDNPGVQAFQAQIAASTPLGRVGQPQDIGRVAVFLASDNSGWITGKSLLVDGGHF
jgi:NAD(P)-dependent dehydrogenase (short-subunit alcohol dehydrogenase family)